MAQFYFMWKGKRLPLDDYRLTRETDGVNEKIFCRATYKGITVTAESQLDLDRKLEKLVRSIEDDTLELGGR